MKKLFCAIAAAALCATLAACAATDGDRSNTQANQKNAKEVIKDMIEADKDASAPATDAAPPATDGAPATEAAEATEATEAADGTSAETPAAPPKYENCDVDLTALSSTMVYSEVYNMMMQPGDYLGKTVKMSGAFKVAPGDGRYYFLCLIADATACCSQGMEFILADGRKYPDEYPPIDTEITVTGVFDTYYEGNTRYCQLIDAVMS